MFGLVFSVWSVGSIVSGRCGQETIIVGRHRARKLLTSRQLLGKREASDGRQREQGARDKIHPSKAITACSLFARASSTL